MILLIKKVEGDRKIMASKSLEDNLILAETLFR